MTDRTSHSPAGTMRTEVVALLAVVREVLADLNVWASVRERAPGEPAAQQELNATLASVGVLSSRMLPASEGGLTVTEAAALVHATGEVLSPVGLPDLLAVSPLLAKADPKLVADISAGAAAVALGIPATGRGDGITFVSPAIPDVVALASSTALTLHPCATGH